MKKSPDKDNPPLITVICDNYTVRQDLEATWGFACWIAHDGRNILFDTGCDGIVLSKNMARLGLNPAAIDLMMISHQHWDHTGGVYFILDANRNLRVSIPRSFSVHFKADMKRYGAKLIEADGAREISPGFYTTGELDGPIQEQAALVSTSAGIAVITGCAHPGIIKIVEMAKTVLPEDNLALVMGGFHLFDEGDNDILKAVSRLKAMNVRYCGASHCSGERARELFNREYRERFVPLGAGSVITLENLK